EDLESYVDAIADHEHREASAERPRLAFEPLFGVLLREAIAAIAPEDQVLADYALHVAPRLSALLGHVAAKGGDFAVKKREAGAPAEDVARYGDDQSMRAHLINGLLPTVRVARTFRLWGCRRFVDDFDEQTYRLFCAGYTLHDWLKLPQVDTELRAAGLEHHTVNVAVHLADVERIVRGWCAQLGLDPFLAPIGGVEANVHNLIYIATNTQLQWGTMHNLAALPGLRARGRSLRLATDLATLADYLAYLGRTPIDAASHPAIQRMFELFDDGTVGARLTYHHLADVRGVLTSIINNAAIAAYAIPDQREPLLYAPTGVVYLERRGAPKAPTTEAVADMALARIGELCQRQLRMNLTGFGRDGKGIKYAAYYELFFSPRELALLVAQFAERRIAGKDAAAGKRYANIMAKAMAPADTDLALPDGLEVDRIAETCAMLVKIAAEAAPDLDAEGLLLELMGVSALRELVRRINSNKTAGGVPYGWYYAAGVYRRNTPGLDEQQWVERLHALAAAIAAHLPDTAPTAAAGWRELHRYVVEHLRFGAVEPESLSDRLQTELARYSGARKSGHGATTVCALCSSPYSVSKQQEAAILFAPMVYTNKQPLHSSKAIRHICAVCGAEMMLRQLLMKRGRESGGNFEKRKLRYLFFYPTYFFTPESLRMLRAVYDRLRRVRFTALRELLLPPSDTPEQRLALTPELFQRLQELMLHPSEIVRDEDDRLFRLRFPESEPITFSFIGLPPGERDAKDAEAWVNPAFLALVLPLLLDVKVVASESLLPIVQEATELPETVAFDGAHTFVRRLAGPARLNLDQLLPALQRLTVSYLVHLDGNAKVGAGGYDYRWHELPAVARNLETSPLYAFHYLKKGLRRDAREGVPDSTVCPTPRHSTPGLRRDAREGVPDSKASLYIDLVEHYLEDGSKTMSHAHELVRLYRLFYRHRGKVNTNSVLRPLSEAASVILEANLRLFADDEALVEAVRGRLEKFIDNVRRGTADGAVPVWLYEKEQVREGLAGAIDAFARYFVMTIYVDVFGRDRAALAGKQLNLLKNACESIYMAEQRREWRERNELVAANVSEDDVVIVDEDMTE
ncbi:MAG: type I-D CRISPR-associated protein Cas10d/Csc3, partial [Chloroflexi bacterium]|nr:type I-D CRISPR-associated protein Cas10d/Csc3 [Chloroflexota bacterium]